MSKYYSISVLSLVALYLLFNVRSAEAETIRTVNLTTTSEVLDLNTNPIRTTQSTVLSHSSQENLGEEKSEIRQSVQAQRRSRRNRSIPTAPNYLGLGGSLGLIENVYGDFGALAVNSKLKLLSIIDSDSQGGTDLSFRPSAIVGKDLTFAVPVTIDFRLPGFSEKMNAFVPYFGPGFSVTTDDGTLYFLLSGGVDFPIGDFTVNGQLNLAFEDDTALGLTLGIGYNF